MQRLVFVSDLHISASCGIRNGDYLQDISSKLRWVVDYVNGCNGRLLIGGDIFDRPTVPDFVKNTITPILLGCKFPPIVISGNHDLLYGNVELKHRTSFGILESHRIVECIDGIDLDLGECVITNKFPVRTFGKPLIIMKHGFLNIEDGDWTFRYSDITTSDDCLVLLGHDHREYAPLEYSKSCVILRCGSFSRIDREESSMRQPKILDIGISGGKIMYHRMIDIPVARSFDEIFKSKVSVVSKSERSETYEAIIEQIRACRSEELTLSEALRSVSSEVVSDFICKLLERSRSESV